MPTLPPVVRGLLVLAGLLLLLLLAPFPGPQAIVHAALVLGLAVDPASSLLTALYAAAAGWMVEGSLRMVPHLGGTAWADMSLALLAAALLRGWPVKTWKEWWPRLLLLHLLQILAVQLAVRMASGTAPWANSWLWSLLTLPLWGWLLWRWQRPRGR
ncbi:MAG TPA: hypothetical protein VJ600_04975 [Holophagaceae bacterium]|nr:hypothetical protein [Holophagaceae bacterium]